MKKRCASKSDIMETLGSHRKPRSEGLVSPHVSDAGMGGAMNYTVNNYLRFENGE